MIERVSITKFDQNLKAYVYDITIALERKKRSSDNSDITYSFDVGEGEDGISEKEMVAKLAKMEKRYFLGATKIQFFTRNPFHSSTGTKLFSDDAEKMEILLDGIFMPFNVEKIGATHAELLMDIGNSWMDTRNHVGKGDLTAFAQRVRQAIEFRLLNDRITEQSETETLGF